MLKSLIVGFLKALPFKACRFLYHELLAQWYMFRLKLRFDGFSWRLIRNQFLLHPRPPRWLTNIRISDYIGWNMPEMEKLLRKELDWKTPHDLKVPYMRFDCHYSALIDRSFERVTGIPLHAVLANHFVQMGYISREELAADMEYLTSEEHIRKGILRAATELGIDADTL